MKNKNQKNEVVETQVTEEIGTDVAVVEKKSFFGKVKKVLPSKEDSTLVKAGKVTGIIGVVGGLAYGGYKLASAVFGGSDSEAEDEYFDDEDSMQDEDGFIDTDAEILDDLEGSENSETEAENVEA